MPPLQPLLAFVTPAADAHHQHARAALVLLRIRLVRMLVLFFAGLVRQHQRAAA